MRKCSKRCIRNADKVLESSQKPARSERLFRSDFDNFVDGDILGQPDPDIRADSGAPNWWLNASALTPPPHRNPDWPAGFPPLEISHCHRSRGSSCIVLIDSGNQMANRPGNRFIRVRHIRPLSWKVHPIIPRLNPPSPFNLRPHPPIPYRSPNTVLIQTNCCLEFIRNKVTYACNCCSNIRT